jgi:hypothetical protein
MPGWEDRGAVGAVSCYELAVYAVPGSVGVAMNSWILRVSIFLLST